MHCDSVFTLILCALEERNERIFVCRPDVANEVSSPPSDFGDMLVEFAFTSSALVCYVSVLRIFWNYWDDSSILTGFILFLVLVKFGGSW